MIGNYGVVFTPAEVLRESYAMASEHLSMLQVPLRDVGEAEILISRVEFVQLVIRSNGKELLDHDMIQLIVELLVNPEDGMIRYGDVQALIAQEFVPYADREKEPIDPGPDPSFMAMQDILLPLRTALREKKISVRDFYKMCDIGKSKNMLASPREMMPQMGKVLDVGSDYFDEAD